MSYDVIIIEDERHQLELLSSMLRESFPDFNLVATASDIEGGRVALENSKPDLAFLDVRLGNYTSFDLLNTLPAIPFDIIFTTSYEEYALQAFRTSAVDYLLKPVDQNDLYAALKKFTDRRRAHDSADNIRNMLANLTARTPAQAKVALPTLTGFIFVGVKDIVRCQSDNTYTTFFLSDKRKIIVSKTLKECEHMLSGYNFFRVHNSHVINLDYIEEYRKGEVGVIKMADGSHVDVSRRRKEEFLKQLRKE